MRERLRRLGAEVFEAVYFFAWLAFTFGLVASGGAG